jgi:hypothetical protein
MNEQEQAGLLEEFLLALRQDANAAPPPGLDPALAAFARKLVAPSAAPSNAVRDRVWQRALAEVRPDAFSTDEKQEQIPMTQIAVLPRRRAYPLAFAAAALVLIALTGVFAASFANRPKEEPLLALAQTTQEPTATLQPTLVPTSTPVPGMPSPATIVPPAPTLVPAAVLSVDTSNAVNISVGDTLNGALTAEKPALTYRLVAPQDGLLVVYLEAKDDSQPTVTILSPHFSPGFMFVPAQLVMQAVQTGVQGQMATVQAAAQGQLVTAQAQVQGQLATVQALAQSQAQLATAQADAQSQLATAQALVQGQLTTAQAAAQGQVATAQAGVQMQFGSIPTLIPANLPPPGQPLPAAPALQPVIPSIGVGPLPAVPVVTLPNVTFGPGTYPVPVHGGDEVILQVSGAAPGAFRINTAQVEENRLQYGAVAENALTDSSFIYYTFEGQAGDLVNIAVDGDSGFDTNLELWSGDFSTRYADDDGGAGSNPEFYHLPLMQTGTYHLLIQAAVPGATGRFRLSLDKVKSLSLDGGPQQVMLNARPAPLTFSGKAGEGITLEVKLTGGSPRYSIYLEQNGALFGQFDNGPLGVVSMPATVPADGPVQVYIVPLGGTLGTASMEVSLKR